MEIRLLRVDDNYVYLLGSGRTAAVIDPTSASPVLCALDGRELELVLVTHHHFDHVGGCRILKDRTGVGIAGPAGKVDTELSDGDSIEVCGEQINVMSVPGHTSCDIAYYCSGPGAVFTGDVMFAAGCGRVFGGNYELMWQSLLRLRSLPDETLVYCGHDYTVENLEFALNLEPSNEGVRERLESVRASAASGRESVPSRMIEEKNTNPFLRCDQPGFASAIGLEGAEPVDVFRDIRSRKDRW